MNFLAMIIALLLLQVWGSGDRIHYDQWFANLRSTIGGLGWTPTAVLLVSIGLPIVGASVFLSLLEPLFFGLGWIAGTAFILLYSLGRGDFQALLARYRSYCQSEDFEGAYLNAQSDLAYEPSDEGPASIAEFQLQIQRCLLYEGYQRWFAVLFYFVVLGPEGALAYRLLHLSAPTAEGDVAKRVLYYVDWIPVRLLTATFTLAGDFILSRDKLMASLQDSDESAGSVLLNIARAALGMDKLKEADPPVPFGEFAASQLADIEALLSRSAISWLVLISILVLLL